MKASSMKQIIETAEKAAPVGMMGDVPAVSFEDYVALTSKDMIDKTDTLGLVQFNPDGTPAATPVKYVAVNVESVFLNRYRKVRSTIQVVTDYRCIKEQATGKVPLKQVPCYSISRGEDGKLKLDKQMTVSDTEFLSDFTHSLDRESMTEILPLLVGTGISKDKTPI